MSHGHLTNVGEYCMRFFMIDRTHFPLYPGQSQIIENIGRLLSTLLNTSENVCFTDNCFLASCYNNCEVYFIVCCFYVSCTQINTSEKKNQHVFLFFHNYYPRGGNGKKCVHPVVR